MGPGMSRFENDEISFEVPEEWHDASRVMFVYPETETNISLTKRVADPAIPLAEYARSLVRLMASQWAELKVVQHGDVRVGDDIGAHVEVEWEGPNGRQRSIARLVFRDRDLWSFTATAPVAKLDETKAAVDRVMRSFATVK